MNMFKKMAGTVSIIVLALAVVTGCSFGNSGKFPSTNLQMIVPYSAGGGTDTLARVLASFMEDEIDKSVLVVNKPGAQGEIGMKEIEDSKTDGHQLGFLSYPDNVILSGYKNTSYNNDNFIHLALFSKTPNVLVVTKDSPFETVEDLVNYAKEHPGEVTVSVSGDAHLLVVKQFEQLAGIELSTVMFSSGGESTNAVVGGHVDASVMAALFAQSAEDQGARTIAVASDKRMEKFNHVPTFLESGYDIQVVMSRVLVAPRGTPDDRIDSLIEILDKVGAKAEFKEKVEDTGEIFEYLSGDALNEYIAKTSAAISKVVEENKEAFTQ